MDRRVGAWLATLAMIGLAGCTAEDPKTQSDDAQDFEELELEATEDTGILRGVVIDEAIRPLAGVLINALGGEANRTMETGDDGLFGFDGLPPGTYFVTARKAGYIDVQTSAEVVAGEREPAAVKILLPADPLTQPYVQPYHMDGFMECSLRPMFLGLQCNLPGGEASVVNADYDLGPTMPMFLQSEMVWDSTQAIGDELSLAIRCLSGDLDPAGKCPDGTVGIVRSEGVSPQIASVNRTLIEQWALGGPGGNPLVINLFAFGRSDLDVWNEQTIDAAQKPVTGNDCMQWGLVGQVALGFDPATCMRLTGPGAVVNQKIDVYTHVFYGFSPPEGWSFVAGEPVPTPP